MDDNPIIFISYSWDSEDHKNWVRKLADRLISDGIQVILDQYDLNISESIVQFTEISLKKCDKIIMIFTPNYVSKAENRKGGVGFEYSIISQEMYEKQSKQQRIIPVLRGNDAVNSIPSYIRQFIYVDFNDELRFEINYENLVRHIYNEPKIKKPPLGKKPNFSNNAVLFEENIYEQIFNLSKKISPGSAAPREERRKIIGDILEIGHLLNIEDILKLGNLVGAQHKVAAGLCLRAKIDFSKIDFGKDKNIQFFILEALRHTSSFVRYRAVQIINRSEILSILYMDLLKQLVIQEQNIATQNEMRLVIRNFLTKDTPDKYTLKRIIQTLIKDNETEVALDKLYAYYELHNLEIQNDVLVIMSNYKDMARNSRIGIIDNQEASIIKNRTNKAILEIININ